MSSRVIKLKTPIPIPGTEGEVLSEIELPKRLLVKQMKQMDRGDGEISKSALLIAAIAKVSPAVIDEMEASDFEAVSRQITGFFGIGSEESDT